MLNFMMLAVFTSVFFSPHAPAKVIYGEDNRVEVSEASPFLQELARSTSVMVHKQKIHWGGLRTDILELDQVSLRTLLELPEENQEEFNLFSPSLFKQIEFESIPVCEGERFVDQPSPGMCSGFLVAHDLLVTAGHCVRLNNFCSSYEWVFDFVVDPVTKKAGHDIKKENVYSCKKVLSTSVSLELGLDYAIIQLDRSVTGRRPLELRNNSKVENFTGLVLIGSPSGLPVKVATGAVVRDNQHPFYFTTNTDSYQGNSGSAVFNAKTGVVEGILVRGDDDFIVDPVKNCLKSNKCPNEGCRGEDVSRLTSIPEISLQVALNQAASNGDLENLMSILKLNIWVDFYGKDGQSALMKAAQNGQMQSMRLLLARGADINLKDINGNTASHYLLKSPKVLHMEALVFLAMTNADLNLKNNAGQTPYDFSFSVALK